MRLIERIDAMCCGYEDRRIGRRRQEHFGVSSSPETVKLDSGRRHSLDQKQKRAFRRAMKAAADPSFLEFREQSQQD